MIALFICKKLLETNFWLRPAQAVSLLDDLDKELNNYIMRCREGYGWHFPELGKIITDNIAFVRTVDLMGTRDNAKSPDLSGILPEEVGGKLSYLEEPFNILGQLASG